MTNITCSLKSRQRTHAALKSVLRFDKPIAPFVSLAKKKQVGICNEIAFSATMNSKFGCILHGYTRRNAYNGVTKELVDSCGLD